VSLPRVVFATGNAHKAEELAALVAGKLAVETLAMHAGVVMPDETGTTFEANAILKAEHVARALGLPAIADDSGLEVIALGGAPGVRSARYAEGSDADRSAKLLGALRRVPDPQRTARFVCALAWVVPGAKPVVVEGKVEGRIGQGPRGDGGFGYDPVFLVGPDHQRTMAELPVEAKNRLSHRGNALLALLPTLKAHFFA
jgi:XTP/dITP diphosphohydrolase